MEYSGLCKITPQELRLMIKKVYSPRNLWGTVSINMKNQ